MEKPASTSFQSSEAEVPKLKKFSDFLTSPIFSIEVGRDDSKKFLVHSELLVYESDRLAKDIHSGFSEESSKRILLPDEEPGLFGYFVRYLYQDECIETKTEKDVQRDSDYIILARLYALGERLQAQKFQSTILRKFTLSWSSRYNPPILDQVVCEILDIACSELPERMTEDPLREQIFWYAASRLTQLRDYDYFQRLLETHNGLGKYICMRAGNGSKSAPRRSSTPIPPRFKPESIYLS